MPAQHTPPLLSCASPPYLQGPSTVPVLSSDTAPSPVALPLSHDRASSCLLRPKCGFQAGCFGLARWLQAPGTWGGFSEQGVLLGQKMLFMSCRRLSSGGSALAPCPYCRHGTGSASTGHQALG